MYAEVSGKDFSPSSIIKEKAVQEEGLSFPVPLLPVREISVQEILFAVTRNFMQP